MSDRTHRERSVHAPELDGAVAWLNTARPLRMADLRGHLVVLDFWTYCCINCMHVLPVLRDLEERHKNDPLVVIGVHSGKFTGEKDPERVAEAIARFGVTHPVVVDSEMRIWRAYAVRSWPTLVVVRPDGTIAAIAPGEPDPDVLEQFVVKELLQARKEGTLGPGPLGLTRAQEEPTSTLAFPGKVVVARDGRMIVSDSGHHRVVLLAPDGRCLDVAGSGTRGRVDGSFEDASFDDPQGLALSDDESTLFVADARAHVVRKLDLGHRTVSTFAGTGELGGKFPRGRVPARETPLRSPWDLALDEQNDTLYVAMAGSHQVFQVSLSTRLVGLLAGTGAESIDDGPLVEATFSQPSGLALSRDRRALYVADAETSAVRVIDLGTREVKTLVGEGLFEFGDVDGPTPLARLQHCMGICLTPNGVVVADTYNHKLRLLDLTAGEVRTIWRGHGDTMLREPTGVAFDPRDESLVVADTNHHRLLRVSLTGDRAVPVVPTGLAMPSTRGPESTPLEREWFTAQVEPTSAGHGLGPGRAVLHLELQAPEGREIAAESPLAVSLEVSCHPDLLRLSGPGSHQRSASGGQAEHIELAVEVAELSAAALEAQLIASIDYVSCDKGTRTCTPEKAWFRIPVRLVKAHGTHNLRFQLLLPA